MLTFSFFSDKILKAGEKEEKWKNQWMTLNITFWL